LGTDNLANERDEFVRISRSNEYTSHVRGVARKAAREAQKVLSNRQRGNRFIAERTNPSLRYEQGRLPLAERRRQLNVARDAAAARALRDHLQLAERRYQDLPFFEAELMTPSDLSHQLPLNVANQRAFMTSVIEVYTDLVSDEGWFYRFVRRNIHNWYRECFVIRGLPGAENRQVPAWSMKITEHRESITFHFEIDAMLGSINGYSFEQHAFVAFTVCAFWDHYVCIFIPGEVIETTDRRIQFPPPSSTECGGSMSDEEGRMFYVTRAPSATEQCNRIVDLSEKLEGVQEDPASSLFEFQGSDTNNPDSREPANSALTVWHDHFANFSQNESDILQWSCNAELVMFFKPTAFNNFNNRLLEFMQVLDPNYRDLLLGHLNTLPVYNATIDEA